MRDRVKLAKRNPRVREIAIHVVHAEPGKFWFGEIRAIFNFVRDRVRYTLDINDIELVQDPLVTLDQGAGDCDDMCVLLASLLECVGHRCRFVALSFDGPTNYSHVIVQTKAAGEGTWISLDPTEDHPAGWHPPDSQGAMVVDAS
jgi:transglutaminase-like putative cysteine protease